MLLVSNRCVYLVILSLACASVCCANPVIGPETPICPTYSPAPGSQDGVEIAAGSDGYLAVWHDTRGGDGDVFGTRISSTGQVLDQAAIPICQYAGDQLDPAVAWNGAEYLVVWSDRRLGLQHIYGCRVRPTGEVIDKQAIPLSGTSGTQAYPKVASDGAGWEVVWQDSRGGTQDIYGCKITGAGSIGRNMGISTQSGNNEETPDIAFNGTTYLVVWRDQRNSASTDSDIYGCRVAKTGLRMGSDILISCNSAGTSGVVNAQQNPRVARSGSDCMVVWEDYRAGVSNADIYCARVNSAGTVLDRNGRPVATGTEIQELPGIGYDGARLLIAWRERTYRFIRGARVSTSGTVLDPSGFNIYPAAAGSDGIGVCGWPGGGFRVGWNNLSMAGCDALMTFVPGTGSFGGSYGTFVSLGLDDQAHYSVADTGTEYGVVWSQQANGKSCIMAARVSHSGELLTPTAVNLTAYVYGQQTQPSIAWNGSEYLVAWCGDETFDTSGLDIRGFRLYPSLQPKEANPIGICSVAENQITPCVASNGNKFLVVWEDSRDAMSPTYYTNAYGALVDANGTVTALGSAVSMSSGDQRRPCATSDGTDFYVVWEDYRSNPRTYGVKVSSTGVVASPTGTAMPLTSSSETAPNVCYGNGYYLVTWSDGTRIAGCRVNQAGTVADTSGINIDSGAAAKSRPSAWWDGANYQTVWEDYRSAFAGNSDIYYTTLGSNGVVSSDPKPSLASALIPELCPLIFGNTSSGALFYQRYECYANGICIAPITQQGLQEVSTITDAKSMPSGSLIVLRGKVVTAALSGFFYAEEPDRSNGIKVVSGGTVHVGDIVDVTGAIGTYDGERQIITGSVVGMGMASEPLGPFGIRGDALGGAAKGSTPGITGARGANNIGLLVRTWGKVTSTASGYFYIESKPGTSIRVNSGSLVQPAVNKMVVITGISTCEVTSGAICRVIMPRQQTDIQVLN